MPLAARSSVALSGEVERLVSEIRAVTAKVRSLVAELRAERLKSPHESTATAATTERPVESNGARVAADGDSPGTGVVPPPSM
jgi:hypothetical protein